MIRMILAAVIAYALMPTDLTPRISDDESAKGANDALGVARSILSDAAMFCDRNPKVCETGRSLIFQAQESAQTKINQLSETESTSDPLADQNTSNPIVVVPEN